MSNFKQFQEALTNDAQMQERAGKISGSGIKNEPEMLTAIVEFAAKEGFVITADEAKTLVVNGSAGLSDAEMANISGGAGKVKGIDIVVEPVPDPWPRTFDPQYRPAQSQGIRFVIRF